MSIGGIAEGLGVGKDTVCGWTANKDMPAQQVGRLWKFKADEVNNWVRTGKASVTSAADSGESQKKRIEAYEANG